MQRRLDRSLGVIERRLSARISRFEKAKSSLSDVRHMTTEAHVQLNEWRLAHQGVRRLPERMAECVRDNGPYPWSWNYTAKTYRKYVDGRFKKHRGALRSTIDELRAYVDQFRAFPCLIESAGFANQLLSDSSYLPMEVGRYVASPFH